jgi:hypothetical protein
MGHRVKIVGTLSDKHATFLALNKSWLFAFLAI